MALTKVNTGGLAADAVDNTILKLDDAFAFTGTVSGAGTKILLRDITISSATASVEFIHGSNNVILDTTYPRYELNAEKVVPATDNAHIELFMSSNSGSSYYGDSAYNLMVSRRYTNSSDTANDTAYYNDFIATSRQSSSSTAATGGLNATVIITGMGAANRTLAYSNFWGFGGSNYYIHTISLGAYESNTVVMDAIKWAFASGNIASGRFTLYGVK